AIGIGVVGFDLDLLGKIRDRAIIIVVVSIDPSSKMIGAGVLWLALDPGGEIIDGARGVAPERVDSSPDFVSDSGSRIDVDRPAGVDRKIIRVAMFNPKGCLWR